MENDKENCHDHYLKGHHVGINLYSCNLVSVLDGRSVAAQLNHWKAWAAKSAKWLRQKLAYK